MNNMIEEPISESVLTIGCQCKRPTGGIAMVLRLYKENVFKTFRFVPSTDVGSLFKKLIILFFAYLKCEWLYTTDKSIKIVHVHTSSYNSFLRASFFIRQAKRHGLRVVCHVHSGAFKDYRNSRPKFVDAILRKCDVIVALSSSWRKYFVEEIGLNKVVIINNIIAHPKLIGCRINDGRCHLLFLGAITEAKGLFDLLECIGLHHCQWQGRLALHVLGKGKVEQLQRRVEDLHIGDIVAYEGWADETKKAELLSKYDAFILPSHFEGVPLSILEAMSYGMPVLATNVGGIPDVVKQNINGLLFPPRDLSKMAASINKLLDDDKFFAAACEQNRIDVKSYFPEAAVDSLSKLYVSLLG